MTFPHFGQIVLRDASAFARLIFVRLTTPTVYTVVIRGYCMELSHSLERQKMREWSRFRKPAALTGEWDGDEDRCYAARWKNL
jgi:hypothetical protein